MALCPEIYVTGANRTTEAASIAQIADFAALLVRPVFMADRVK